jgi:hypothetical protein
MIEVSFSNKFLAYQFRVVQQFESRVLEKPEGCPLSQEELSSLTPSRYGTEQQCSFDEASGMRAKMPRKRKMSLYGTALTVVTASLTVWGVIIGVWLYFS